MSLSKSPLRYPGGKQKLAPFLIELLKANNLIGGYYIEPYAGGAGAAIYLLLNGFVRHIHLNDSSYPIYAFWRSILTRNDDFCRLVSAASLSIEEWKRRRNIVKNYHQYDELEVGFSTFYLNRCNRSGVISGGVIGGLEQMGEWKMDARFSKKDLIKRIAAVASFAQSITLSNVDAESYLDESLANLPADAIIYFDPPYYKKSSGLYLDTYVKQDHQRIAIALKNINGVRWLLSYDAAEQILALYDDNRHFLYDLQYNAASVYKGKEVLVFSNNIVLPSSSSLPFIDIGLKHLVDLQFV